EPFEQELIEFWDSNRTDIESVERELLQLWKFSSMPVGSAAHTLRGAIQRLRSTADGLRARSTTISHPDANALLAHFEAWRNSRNVCRTCSPSECWPMAMPR